MTSHSATPGCPGAIDPSLGRARSPISTRGYASRKKKPSEFQRIFDTRLIQSALGNTAELIAISRNEKKNTQLPALTLEGSRADNWLDLARNRFKTRARAGWHE